MYKSLTIALLLAFSSNSFAAQSALLSAAAAGDGKRVLELLEKDPLLNTNQQIDPWLDCAGNTALHLLINHWNNPMVREACLALLAQGANGDTIRNKKGLTASELFSRLLKNQNKFSMIDSE